MEVITIESGAFKQLVEKLDAISEHLQLIEHPGERDDESWVVSNEICRFLKIYVKRQSNKEFHNF